MNFDPYAFYGESRHVPPLMLTQRAAAAALAISEQTFLRLVAEGGVQPVMIGDVERFAVRDLLQMIDRMKDVQHKPKV